MSSASWASSHTSHFLPRYWCFEQSKLAQRLRCKSPRIMRRMLLDKQRGKLQPRLDHRTQALPSCKCWACWGMLRCQQWCFHWGLLPEWAGRCRRGRVKPHNLPDYCKPDQFHSVRLHSWCYDYTHVRNWDSRWLCHHSLQAELLAVIMSPEVQLMELMGKLKKALVMIKLVLSELLE